MPSVKNHEDRIYDNSIKVRHWSADICTLLEDLLADYDLYIPDVEREGDEDEACLYGDTYTELEEFVTEKLIELKNATDSLEDIKDIKDVANKFIKDVCDEFDSIIVIGLESIDNPDDRPDIGHCDLEDRVEEDMLDFLACVRKYPTYEIDTYNY